MKTKYLLFLVISLAMGGSLFAQDFNSSYNFVTPSSKGPGTSFANTNVAAFAISWNTSPPITSCAVQVDSSSDGVAWGSGDLIASQNCAVVGSVAATALATGKNFVRITVTTLNGTGGLNVTLKGYAGSASGSSSASSQGPVINVTNSPYNASPALADNNAAFTAAFAASNALKSTTPVVGPRTAPSFSTFGSASSYALNFTVLTGDTVYVFIVDSNNRTFSVSDDGGSTGYAKIGSTAISGGGDLQVFRTAIGGGVQSSIVTITQAGGAEGIAAAAIALPNVLSDNIGTLATGSSTTPSISQTTTAANSFELASCVWYSGGNDALTNSAGSLRSNTQATVSFFGLALWGTAQAAVGTVTSSGTLAVTAPWSCQTVEVKSGASLIPVIPTVYIPYGYYYYSGGINPTQATTIQCAPGTWLNYTGVAHAADLGPTGLTFLTAHHNPYILDGCNFTGGAFMTQGIFMTSFVENVGIRNNYFYNFGNVNSSAITSNGENWDVEIGPQNRFVTDDYQPRGSYVLMNAAHLSVDSFLRFHDNQTWCIQGFQNLGCSATQSFPFVIADGYTNRVYHNNMMFGNPAVRFNCTSGTCGANQADQNQIEGPASGTYNIFQFGGTQFGMLVTQNTTNMHSTTGAWMGPVGGTDVLLGARINFNTVYNFPAASVLVSQNNLAGQTGNYSYTNECHTGTGALPCPNIHTTGGNITQWNADQWPQIAFAAATTGSYTFSTTYASAPKCGAPVATSPGAVTFTITTLSTTTLTVTASGSFTGTVTVPCSAGDGQ